MNPNFNSENTYIEELKKCLGKVVQVVREDGQTFKGICKAISFTHLNIVLMTETHKIIIKNISHIIRERDSGVTNSYHKSNIPQIISSPSPPPESSPEQSSCVIETEEILGDKNYPFPPEPRAKMGRGRPKKNL